MNYENADPYPVLFKQGDLRLVGISDPKRFYRVDKWKFGGKRGSLDKTTVVYNHNLTLIDIPLEAYEYPLGATKGL